MMYTKSCKFCGVSRNVISSDMAIEQFECPICGDYQITHEAYVDLPNLYDTDLGHVYSGVLRERQEIGFPIYLIRRDNIYDLIKTWNVPKTVKDKLDRIILHLDRRNKRLDKEIDLDEIPYSIGYAWDRNEFLIMLKELGSQGYVRRTDKGCALTFKGHEYAGKLKERNIISKQGFVAMWFHPEMNGIYKNYIHKAIKDAGFEPMCIDAKEFNDEICDHIIAEIRKSKFLVADFTGNRDGVYYEAGFARGLGIEVICTCREDWFKGEVMLEREANVNGNTVEAKIKEGKVHFDIDHRKFIIWRDGKDLYENLKARIEATIH